ncbi:MAG: FeoB-associated Cys-rich membrane protein [Peptococcaceae bacterium]|nr:FeoB-associated Cys-rich membrane protein [Peptococcaceae bacterium]
MSLGMATIIVGIIFFLIIGFGTYRYYKSIQSNTCPGCTGGACSDYQNNKGCKN